VLLGVGTVDVARGVNGYSAEPFASADEISLAVEQVVGAEDDLAGVAVGRRIPLFVLCELIEGHWDILSLIILQDAA